LQIFVSPVRDVGEGYLLQNVKARLLDITEEVYYDIIRQKTATLIAACCSMGACSVRPDSAEVETFRKFGELCGMAFQIKDDLFDYGEEAIGKTTGIDIKEQKRTLPLIYALSRSDSKRKKWLINSVKNHNKDRKRVREVIAYVKDMGGLEYAVGLMIQFKDRALSLLDPYPDSQYKKALVLMVEYV